MAAIEDKVATEIAGKLDKSDESTAKPSGAFGPLHGGGPGIVPGLNYSPGDAPGGGGAYGQHEGAGTRPLNGDFVAPTGGAEGAVAEQARADDFASVVAQVKLDRAAAAESYRRYCRGPVEPTGYVSGLDHLQSKHERTKK